MSPFLAVLMEHAAQDPATEMLSSLAGGDAMERNEKLRKDQTLLCCQGSALRIMSACVSERDFCVCAPTKTISVCVCVCVCVFERDGERVRAEERGKERDRGRARGGSSPRCL